MVTLNSAALDLVLHQLYVHFPVPGGLVRAVDGVDICFRHQQITGIIGESGCGKSTLASILMGRNKGYTGSVSVGGVPLSSIQEESLLRNITYISHQSYLFKGTVRESLQMGDDRAGDEALWRVLERVRLADFLRAEKGLDTPLTENAGNLSGGWQRRCSIAMALISEPKILFLDEPTLGLDVLARSELWDLIKELKGKVTVILTTHYMEEAEALADRVGIMKSGRLITVGTPAEIKEEAGTEKFEDAFITLVKGAKK